jgi:signal transduction histidine kinase
MTDYFASHLGLSMWPAILALVILEAVAVYAWQFRRDAAARFLIYIQCGQMGWLLTTLLAMQCVQANVRVFWLDCEQLISLFCCILWYLFVLSVKGDIRSRMRWPLSVICLLFLVVAALIGTDPWLHAYWIPYGQLPGARIPGFSWANHLESLLAHGIVFLAMYEALGWYRKEAGLRRHLAKLALLGGTMCWIGQLLTMIPAMSFLAPLPSGFALSGIISAWSYSRWRPFNMIALAQEAAVRLMVDGVLVIDEEFRIVALNPIMESFLHGVSLRMGESFEKLVARWPDLAPIAVKRAVAEVEAHRVVRGCAMDFKVSALPLSTPHGAPIGMIVLFTDITLEKKRQAQVLDQHEASARLDERELLGRELHDGSSQAWCFVSMQLETALHHIALQRDDLAKRSLESTLVAVREMHVNMRESILGLQTKLSIREGLRDSIAAQIRWYERYCHWHVDWIVAPEWSEEPLSSTTKVQLLRIVQEALTNIRKSAQTDRVRVQLRRPQGCFEIEVADDGCGFEMPPPHERSGHYGLQIMQRRAQRIGASIEIESALQAGTRVRITVPEKLVTLADAC